MLMKYHFIILKAIINSQASILSGFRATPRVGDRMLKVYVAAFLCLEQFCCFDCHEKINSTRTGELPLKKCFNCLEARYLNLFN